jgi:predicted HTH domain antitoxin
MKINFDLELPRDVFDALRGQDLAAKVKEALVMELLREHQLSQGRAAELLGVSRSDFFPLMAKYRIATIDLSAEELGKDLDQPFPRQ